MSKKIFDQKEVKEALAVIKSVGVPSQPKVVTEVYKEMNREDPDVAKISQLVSKDIGLTAKALKIANSPFFSIKEKADTVDQALVVLGLKNFYNTIVASTLREALSDKGVVNDHFWDHSMITATIASHIAGKTRAISPEFAYTLGLFHDCAIPILVKRFPDYVQLADMAMEHSKAAVFLEERRYNTNHCVAGYLVAKSWHIPDEVCKVIQYHHEQSPEAFKEPLHRKMASVLMLAEFLWLSYITNIRSGKESDEEKWAESHDKILYELNIDIDDIKDFKEDTYDILSKLEDYN